MKILNIMLDGWHPDNLNHPGLKGILDLDQITNSLGYDKYKDYTTDIDPSTERVKSIRMWFRFYGNTYITKSGKSRKPYDSLYLETPSEELLWNKLAFQGVPSFLHPVTYMASKPTKWLLGEPGSATRKASELISGVFKNYRSTKSYILDGGRFTTVTTDHIKSALMPVVLLDMDVSQWANENDVKLLTKLKGSKTDAEFSENFDAFYTELSSNMFQRISENLGGNVLEWDERIIPSLETFTANTESDTHSFVHLSLEESACYNYFFNTREIQDEIAEPYFTSQVLKAIETYRPDVLILNGDHSMVPLDHPSSPYAHHYLKEDSSRPTTYKDVGFTNELGEPVEIPVSSSWAGDYPVYNEHGYQVGARVFYSDAGQEFIDKLDSFEGLNSGELIDPYDDTTLEYLYKALLEVLV